MPDIYSDQLSAYLDGELDPPRRLRLETHLAECGECAALLGDLRAIVAAAPGYQGREPARDLWQDIEARLGEAEVVPIGRTGGRADGPTEPPSRRFSFAQLVAASLLMTAVGGGATWFALRGPAPSDRPTLQPSDLAVRLPDSSKTVAYAEEQYAAAVRDLELLLESGRSRLDTATVRTIELSLQRIDAAIAEARTAVQRDPANAYLSRQIAANMRRKLNLLRLATNAIAART